MSFWLIIVWTILSTLLGYLRVKFTYWELNGVKQLKTHFLFGNFFKLKSLNHADLMQEMYDTFKGKTKVAGMYLYTKPIAVILDLDTVKAVLIKDCHNFENRCAYKNDRDILTAHIFNVESSIWKPLRHKLSPVFALGKMKLIFPHMIKLAQELKQACEKNLNENEEINVCELNDGYITDVMGNCILGIKCNSLKDVTAEFKVICSKVFELTNFNIRWHLFEQTYMNFTEMMGCKRYTQFIEDFFLRVTKESIRVREKLVSDQKDFFDILLDLNNTKDEKGDTLWTLDQIAAQIFVFCVASFETSSGNMSYALYELAKNPKIQEKARQNILRVLKKYNNELTYEAMMEMSYIDQIITETLRLYPALSFLQRVSLNDYKIQGSDITLDKGTNVFIPVHAIHLDPDIYENPKEFKPERFSSSQLTSRHSQSFLGFGDGPRNCIGLRFGRMQNMIGLISLLKNFNFSLCDRTPKSIIFSSHSPVNIPLNAIYLKVEKL